MQAIMPQGQVVRYALGMSPPVRNQAIMLPQVVKPFGKRRARIFPREKVPGKPPRQRLFIELKRCANARVRGNGARGGFPQRAQLSLRQPHGAGKIPSRRLRPDNLPGCSEERSITYR